MEEDGLGCEVEGGGECWIVHCVCVEEGLGGLEGSIIEKGTFFGGAILVTCRDPLCLGGHYGASYVHMFFYQFLLIRLVISPLSSFQRITW